MQNSTLCDNIGDNGICISLEQIDVKWRWRGCFQRHDLSCNQNLCFVCILICILWVRWKTLCMSLKWGKIELDTKTKRATPMNASSLMSSPPFPWKIHEYYYHQISWIWNETISIDRIRLVNHKTKTITSILEANQSRKNSTKLNMLPPLHIHI